jgi:Prokaryotic Cytochrome C oxidase subunit IV
LKTIVALGVWAYMVLAVLTEVEVQAALASYAAADAVIMILAASQAVAIIIFYMQMKDEPLSIKIFALIPIMFLSGLLIAMLASLG